MDVNEDENYDPENQEVGENQEVENENEELNKYEVPISDSESSLEPNDECNKGPFWYEALGLVGKIS